MINIYDDINKLEATLRKTSEFEALQVAVDAVREDEEARTLFTNFRDIQNKLQQQRMNGEELLEDEYNYLQKAAQLAQGNVKILAMLEAEMALNGVLEETMRIITKPIQSLYDGL